jgi:hypothetical protein
LTWSGFSSKIRPDLLASLRGKDGKAKMETWNGKEMQELSRKIDCQKLFTGVILLCIGVLLMILGQEISSPFFKTAWMGLLGVGIFFYLWGRFFSREDV